MHDLMFSTKDGFHDSEDVVGGPRNQEDQQDEGECLCCFSLLLLFLKRFDSNKSWVVKNLPKTWDTEGPPNFKQSIGLDMVCIMTTNIGEGCSTFPKDSPNDGIFNVLFPFAIHYLIT